MGVLGRSQIRDLLRDALGGRDGAGADDTDFNRYIDMGYSLICQPEVRRHEELKARVPISLATDTSEYSISKATVGFNILALRMVEFYNAATIAVDTRRHKLDPRPLEWFSDTQPRSNPGGPRFYHRDGDTLLVSPFPPAADNGKQLRLWVFREPDPLTGNNATVLLDYFDFALVLAAKYHAQLNLGYRELAINTRQELQAYVNQKADDGGADSDTGQRMELRNENPMPRS